MLRDWELLGVIALAFVVGREILIAHPRRIRLKEQLEKQKTETTASKIKPIPKPDFYGIKAAESDPESFKTNVMILQEKLERGEEVPVDAAKAFYLMRNIQHHDLIVGEKGTINMNIIVEDSGGISFNEDKIKIMSNEIMNFKPNENDAQIVKRKSLPQYIRESVPLNCGGVRWVFHDWHAKECGITSLCFDANGRSMPDPDVIIEDKKNKDRKTQKDDGVSIGKLAGEISRLSNIVTDIRGEQILEESKINNTEADIVDEIKTLEEKIPVPDFFGTIEEDDLDAQKDFFGFGDEGENLNNKSFDLSESTIEKNGDGKFTIAYESYESFIKSITGNSVFENMLFKSIFKNVSSDSKIFIDIAGREILIEKNLLMKNVGTFFSHEDRQKFESDFLSPKSIEIYDVNKTNAFLDTLDANNYFVRFGAQKKKLLQKILFASLDHKEQYRVGWYAKATFSSHPLIAIFLEDHSDGRRIEVITSAPKEIESKINSINNLLASY